MSLHLQYQQMRQQIKSEWGSNQRLRLITFLSAVLFVVWGHMQLDRWRESAERQAKRSIMELRETNLAVEEKRWPQREKEAVSALEKIQRRLWKANTEGEAQAALRDWLQGQARLSGLEIKQIDIEVGKPGQRLSITPVRASIRGEYKAGSWQKMIERLGTAVPSVTVEFEQIDITRKPRYRLGLLVWYELGELPGDGGRE